ncbi:hypothetical protein K440DRAFT_515957, partial [Wilcoxina mikolae CBS 423.85]
KTATWLTRLFQWFFAVILMGICSYMIHQYREGHFRVLPEVIVPEVASVLAVFVCTFSIMAIFFLGPTLQMVAALLDFIIFVLYLASAIMLRNNYHAHGFRNPLTWSMIDVRKAQGEKQHPDMQAGVVKTLVALVVIQIFLFFFTTIMGFLVA